MSVINEVKTKREVRAQARVTNITLPPETATEKQFREQVEAYRGKLVKLAETMAGQILWRRVPARQVALSRRGIYLKLNGWRNKAAFDKAWATCPLFQKISVEINQKFHKKFVPGGVFGPLRHSAGIMVFEDPEHDSALPLDLVPAKPTK